MERCDRHVGATNSALQEAPEVLAAIGVNLPIDVALGVVNEAVLEISGESAIRVERIGVDGGAFRDVATNGALETALFSASQDLGTNLLPTVFAVAVEQSHYGNFARHA